MLGNMLITQNLSCGMEGHNVEVYGTQGAVTLKRPVELSVTRIEILNTEISPKRVSLVEVIFSIPS